MSTIVSVQPDGPPCILGKFHKVKKFPLYSQFQPSVHPPSLNEPEAVGPRWVVVGVAGAGDDAVGGGGGAAADSLHRHPEAAPRRRVVGLEGDGGVVAGGGEDCPAVPKIVGITLRWYHSSLLKSP